METETRRGVGRTWGWGGKWGPAVEWAASPRGRTGRKSPDGCRHPGAPEPGGHDPRRALGFTRQRTQTQAEFKVEVSFSVKW